MRGRGRERNGSQAVDRATAGKQRVASRSFEIVAQDPGVTDAAGKVLMARINLPDEVLAGGPLRASSATLLVSSRLAGVLAGRLGIVGAVGDPLLGVDPLDGPTGSLPVGPLTFWVNRSTQELTPAAFISADRPSWLYLGRNCLA